MNKIKDFPPEIVERMLQCQVEQGFMKDLKPFEEFRFAGKNEKGFNWGKTTEGDDFWDKVIGDKDFSVFFDRYPKIESRQPQISLFKSILKNDAIKVSESDDGGLYLTEPNNYPAFYGAFEVLKLADVLGLEALVTVVDGTVEIQIY